MVGELGAWGYGQGTPPKLGVPLLCPNIPHSGQGLGWCGWGCPLTCLPKRKACSTVDFAQVLLKDFSFSDSQGRFPGTRRSQGQSPPESAQQTALGLETPSPPRRVSQHGKRRGLPVGLAPEPGTEGQDPWSGMAQPDPRPAPWPGLLFPSGKASPRESLRRAVRGGGESVGVRGGGQGSARAPAGHRGQGGSTGQGLRRWGGRGADLPPQLHPGCPAREVAVCTFPWCHRTAAHSWAWGWEGRLLCWGPLGGAPGLGGDSQSGSARSLHILLLGGCIRWECERLCPGAVRG